MRRMNEQQGCQMKQEQKEAETTRGIRKGNIRRKK